MYKRNQVEEGIAATLGEGTSGPSDELKTKLKRLLDSDRTEMHYETATSPNYAFYSGAPPGRGVEVWFSSFEAFALLMGLQLMQHGWSQTQAVAILRDVRPELERLHERVLKLDPKRLFDPERIRRGLVSGAAFHESAYPKFMVILFHAKGDRRNRHFKTSVQEDLNSAMRWIADGTRGIGGGAATFEITVPAHQLHANLDNTFPKSRGRSA